VNSRDNSTKEELVADIMKAHRFEWN